MSGVYHRNSSVHNRCPKCKATVEELLKRVYGQVTPKYKFHVGTGPEDYQNTEYYDTLKAIHTSLLNYRHCKRLARVAELPRCDFYVHNPGFIVEFDETQHFTVPRKISLEYYPESLELGFNRKEWMDRCDELKEVDSDEFRDERRAWYDTLRDFLPVIKGLKPTVRLYSIGFEWCSLNPDNPQDRQRFKKMRLWGLYRGLIM